MKKILLLPLIFTFIACGGTDDDTDNVTDNLDDDRPFLEKYDGFGFQADSEEYYYFSDSAKFLKYVEIDDEEDGNYCVELEEGQYIDGNDVWNTSIVTNNSTSLLVEQTVTNNGEIIFTDSYEFTVDATGNSLSIKYDNDPNDVELYTKTSITFASLCD